MKLHISDYPGAYLVAELEAGQELLTEKDALLYADGSYQYKHRVEAKGYKNWMAKALGGKSLTYNQYKAEQPVRMVFAPQDQSEIFLLEITESAPVFFEPRLHFARTPGVRLELQSRGWKNDLNDGLKLKAEGEGQLVLKGYGKIIREEIDTQTPFFVDETALIAFEPSVEIRSVSKSITETLVSGEGFMLEVSGKGTLWLQTRQKQQENSGGGLADGIFTFLR